MKISGKIRLSKSDTCVALGYFDGVHSGHTEVIKNTVRYAKDNNLKSVVLTFDQSPSAVLNSENKETITSNFTKCDIIESYGIDCIFMPEFREYMDYSTETFVREILQKKLKAKAVFCGFNYRFGKGGEGTCDDLKELCRKYGIEAIVIPPVYYNGEPVSSTRIRKCITLGNVSEANAMLGHYFSIDSRVLPGRRLGKKLGFPTLNQKLLPNGVKPFFGVYASVYTYKGISLPAVTNVGIKPTVGSNMPLAETWVFDNEIERMYNRRICVSLIDFIRMEQKFDSVEELKAAVLDSADKSRKILKEHFGDIGNIKL